MDKKTKIKCPHCGEMTFLREKKIFGDAFAVREIKYFCMFCGGEAEPPRGEKGSGKSEAALDKFSKMLGGEEKVKKFSLGFADGESRFCLHCVNYIKHPFTSRCGLTLKEIEATDRCENFRTKE